jgi:Ca-activated chloride channel family protein
MVPRRRYAVEFKSEAVRLAREIGVTEAARRLMEQPVRAVGLYSVLESVPAEQLSAVSVAAFAQRLRGESAVGNLSLGSIAALANDARGVDPEGYRAEAVRLVRMAETIGSVGRAGLQGTVGSAMH